MGYTHYLETDGQLTKEQARLCAEACLDFLDKVPAFVLETLLEKPETLRKEGMSGLAAMNEAVLNRDRQAAQKAMDEFWNGGFAIQPVYTETFSVVPEDGKYMFCKTGGPSVPADPLVVCMHLAAQEALRDGRTYPLRFTSDGDKDCMKLGLGFWRKCTNMKAPPMPFVRNPEPEERPEPEAPAAPSILDGAGVQDAIEAAQCIWEDVLRKARNGGSFSQAGEDLGMAELRGRLREPEVLEACLKGWEEMGQDAMNGAPFDWEYVPLFVDACIDEEDASLRKDWRKRLESALSAGEAPRP